jgi:DNA-binding GntR family transcriptional regulator
MEMSGDCTATRVRRPGRMMRASAPKRDRVACEVRAAILRGDYADGFALSESKLAAKYGVHHSVVWRALADLEREGHVSRDGQRRFHVNASYASHQLQVMRNRLDRVERLAVRIFVILGGDAYDSAVWP